MYRVTWKFPENPDQGVAEYEDFAIALRNWLEFVGNGAQAELATVPKNV